METAGGNHSTMQENPVFGNPHFRIFQRQMCLCSILLHSIYCVGYHHTIQILLQVTSSINNSPCAVMPSLYHLNLPEAFAVHPQPILPIPGKILSTPATCCDPFFYFTTPITMQSSVNYTANPKVGNWTILLHICGSLLFICHHIDAYFSVLQTSKPTTQITHDGKRCKTLFKNTYYYSRAWFIWQRTIQKALLIENFEEHISPFHLLRAPSLMCLHNSKRV